MTPRTDRSAGDLHIKGGQCPFNLSVNRVIWLFHVDVNKPATRHAEELVVAD